MEVDDFEAATQAFLPWLLQEGVIISPKIALVDLRSQGRGRGVVAVEDLMEDEVAFSIPRSAVLNVTNSFSVIDEHIRDAIAAMPPWLALSTIMLAEAPKKDSIWAPYFAVLPQDLDSLVFWSESELAELQASRVVQKIGKAHAEEMFAKHISPLRISHASIEMCHKVSSVVMAYAFDIPENSTTEDIEQAGDDEDRLVSDDGENEETILSMIPLADMLNADAHRNNVRLCCDNEDLEMRAIKPINKGEELFNDYGELPRADLLRRYGYVTENYAPYDVVEISTESLLSMFRERESSICVLIHEPIIPLNQEEIKKRIELAERENVYEDSYDLCLPGSELPSIPDELVALAYILLLEDQHLRAVEISETSLPSRSKLATEMVGRVLAELFRNREKEYPTSIEEDITLFRAGNLSRRTKMAIQVRIGEKRVLKEAITTSGTFTSSNRKMRAKPEQQNLNNQSGQKRGLKEEFRPTKKSRHR